MFAATYLWTVILLQTFSYLGMKLSYLIVPYRWQAEELPTISSQVQQLERHDSTDQANDDDFAITPETNQVSFDFIT